jgi:hypothetical protein
MGAGWRKGVLALSVAVTFRGAGDKLRSPMTESPAAATFVSLKPPDTGGARARAGFDYQDHVTAGICLTLLSDPEALEVWVDYHDDIVLRWQSGSTERLEFIQVKSSEPEQLWSTAMLCSRPSGVGTSVLERSLANDRPFIEERVFRIITARAPASGVACLSGPREVSPRDRNKPPLKALCEELESRIGDFRSECGNTASFWAERAVWEVLESVDFVELRNQAVVRKFAEEIQGPVFGERVASAYQNLLALVVKRSGSPTGINRNDVVAALLPAVIANAGLPPAKTLRDKLLAAGLGADIVEAAQDRRMRFRMSPAGTAYLDLGKDSPFNEVESRMLALMAQHQSGADDLTDAEFHARCLKEIGQVFQRRKDDSGPTEGMLQGAFYERVARCFHRFTRTAA